jgi:hypothetical protein
MIYTAIFKNNEGGYNYSLYDAPHGFSAAWPPIAKDGEQDDRHLIALVPGNHQVGFEDDHNNSSKPFSQPRRKSIGGAK